jgi:hypothetical protein
MASADEHPLPGEEGYVPKRRSGGMKLLNEDGLVAAPAAAAEEIKTSSTERSVRETLNPDLSVTVTTTTLGEDGNEVSEEATYESMDAYNAFKEGGDGGSQGGSKGGKAGSSFAQAPLGETRGAGGAAAADVSQGGRGLPHFLPFPPEPSITAFLD